MGFGLQHFEIYKKRKNKLKRKHIDVIYAFTWHNLFLFCADYVHIDSKCCKPKPWIKIVKLFILKNFQYIKFDFAFVFR